MATDVDPRFVGAWREWLSALTTDADAALAAESLASAVTAGTIVRVVMSDTAPARVVERPVGGVEVSMMRTAFKARQWTGSG